jgi:hypothetical protein
MSIFLKAKGICPRCGYAHGAHSTTCPVAKPRATAPGLRGQPSPLKILQNFFRFSAR